MTSRTLEFVLVFILLVNLGIVTHSFIEVHSTKQPVSPLPAGKVLGTQLSFYSNDLWKPSLEKIKPSSQPAPEITAKSALVVDLSTNDVIYEKNSKVQQPVASTVKILTAIVALETLKPTNVIKVSGQAAKVGEDFMGLTAGEKLTLEDLLYGLLLPSGNDASVTIAEGIAGSEDKFTQLMNEKAKILGAVDSKFINSSGLEKDNVEQYSTAADLAIISKYAWKNFGLFRQIVGTKYYEIPYNAEHKYFYLENQTNLLSTYPGVRGIKPGFTPAAGLCLVTLAENGGHQILAVVLGATDRRGDMEKLLNYSFATQGVHI